MLAIDMYNNASQPMVLVIAFVQEVGVRMCVCLTLITSHVKDTHNKYVCS